MNDSPNDLEQKLRRAADDAASRPEFYKALLEADIFVIGHSDECGEGRVDLPAGAKLSIVNWEKHDGTPVIPFFTSLPALQQALEEEASYLALPARAFFEMTRGAHLVLNPKSAYGKEFFPQEIEALLDTGLNHAPQARVVEQETKVLLGQPANYPHDMVSALTRLLAKHPSVKAAYLCLMHDPSQGDKPALVVGFEGENLTQAMREAGAVAADTAPRGELVDFVVVKKGEEGISEYLRSSVKPFYERSWGAKLRGIFQSGTA